MRFLLNIVLAVAVALVVGFGLSFAALDRGSLFGSKQIGPWVTWPNAGSSNPDPYSRAHLARTPQLVLNVAEGIVFTAKVDSEGAPLSGSCSYRLDGETPQAAFWTLAATDQAGSLITPAFAATSLISTRLAREDDGAAIVRVGSFLAPGNWLQIAPVGTFELSLTLYDAADFAGLGRQDTVMPTISRETCK